MGKNLFWLAAPRGLSQNFNIIVVVTRELHLSKVEWGLNPFFPQIWSK
jgi:hypothetical protein